MTTILFIYLFIFYVGVIFSLNYRKNSINITFTFILANINAYSMNKIFSEELRHLVSFRSNSDN